MGLFLLAFALDFSQNYTTQADPLGAKPLSSHQSKTFRATSKPAMAATAPQPYSCPVFWVFLLGELIWHTIDFATDILFFTQNVQSAEFKEAVDRRTSAAVTSVAAILLVVNGLLLALSQGYLIRTKTRIRREGLDHNSNFLMRIERITFFIMLMVFCLEDAPGLVLCLIVQASTGGFDAVQKAQLITSLAGSIIFLVIAMRGGQVGEIRTQLPTR